jgi:hypothetical protein
MSSLRSYTRVKLAQYALLLAIIPNLLGQEASPTTWGLKGGRLTVASDTIVYERKNSSPVAVPTKAITRVCYDTTAHARGPSTWDATMAMGSGNGEGLIFAPLVLPVVAGVHATKSTRHFISLRWTQPQPDDDFKYELTLEAEKGNFAALLKEFQQLTGKPWTDVNKNRSEVYARFSNQWKSASKEKHTPYLRVKETSRIGNSVLEPYFYHTALRAGPSSEGDLFLFAGIKKEMQPMAVVHVSIKAEKNGDSEGVPIYESHADPMPRVAVIKMPNQTLTITASQAYEYDPACPSLP